MRRVVSSLDARLVARLEGGRALLGVRAGSALVDLGGVLVVVQDDALAVALVDEATLAVETLALASGGSGALPKKTKPDFEAAVCARGALWLLGSGSTPARRRVARIGWPDRSVELFDATPLYLAIQGALGRFPNLEGATPAGDRLRLFHRGAGREDPSAWIDIDAGALAPLMRASETAVLDVVEIDLGDVGGVRLTPTDVVTLPDGRVVYLAAAEDTPDAVSDGPIAGASVGVLDADGGRHALLLDPGGAPSRRKVEGLALDASGRRGWVVTDPDDEHQPAELFRLVLEGPW